MHQNSRFNIAQADGNCNPNFVVIDGQRTNSGHMAHGAKVISGAMSRGKAIELADSLQDAADNPGLQEVMQEELTRLGATVNPFTTQTVK